jgi:hypothetical protein
VLDHVADVTQVLSGVAGLLSGTLFLHDTIQRDPPSRPATITMGDCGRERRVGPDVRMPVFADSTET